MEVEAERIAEGEYRGGIVMVPVKSNGPKESTLPRAFKIEEIADSFQVSTRHIRRKVREGSFPRPINVGKSLRFLEADILSYIENQKQQGAN